MKKLVIIFLTILTLFTISACKKEAISHDHSYETSEVAATCTERGYTLHTCSCGDSYKDSYVDTIAHNYVDGKCVTCTSNDVSKGLEFKYLSDNSYELVSLGDCVDTEIVVPATYNGLPVTSIANDAFYSENAITSIIIPEGVKTIDQDAFGSCYDLVELSIPNSIEEMSKVDLYDCEKLKMKVFNGAYYVGNANNPCVCLVSAISPNIQSVIINKNTRIIGYSAFEECDNLINVEFPLGSELCSISNYAFYDCDNLKEIYIPRNVKSIGTYAFSYCNDLENFELPKSLEKIGSYAFSGCNKLDYNVYGNLQYLQVGDNPYFACVSIKSNSTAITFHKDTNIIIRSLASDSRLITSVTFEDGIEVSRIPDYTFYNCDKIEAINIPEGVKEIGENAFSSSLIISNVAIPNSIEYIADTAFNSMPAMVYNEYNGANYLGNEKNPYVVLMSSSATDITEVTISSQAKIIYYSAFKNNTSLESVTFEENSSLEYIDGYAFNGCDALKSIVIPRNVKEIKEYAFASCDVLESVVIEEESVLGHIGYAVFDACIALKSFDMPNSVRSISERTFYDNNSLESIKLSNNLAYINELAFYGCDSLATVALPSTIEAIGLKAFSKCVSLGSIEIPEGVSIIGYNAFYDTALSEIKLPNSIIAICDFAFEDCSDLTSINIPNKIEYLGNYLFEGCSKLTGTQYDNAYYLGNEENPYMVLLKAVDQTIESCKVNANAIYMHSKAFVNCNRLTGVTFDENSKLKYVQKHLFSQCSELINVSFPESVIKMDEGIFYNCTSLERFTFPANISQISPYMFRGCYSLTSYEVSNNITKIGEGAFYNCDSLMEVLISNSVKEIDTYAFYGCTSLATINIPDGIELIDRYVFSYCESLHEIVIPSSVVEIEEYAFSYCLNLTDVVIPNGVESLSSYAFRGCTGINTIILPVSITSVYNSTFDGCGDDFVICYLGTSKDWKEVLNTNLTNVHYYSSCVHDEFEWTYDGEKIITEIDCTEWIGTDSTCTTRGVKTSICNRCNSSLEKEEPLKPHNLIDSTCKNCGLVIPYIEENDSNYPFIVEDNTIISTNKTHNSKSTYTITMEKSAVLSFKYKVSSETNYDKLFINVNDTNLVTASGTNGDYVEYSVDLLKGDKLTFTYSKDRSQSNGDDCIYIKDISFDIIE